MAPAARFWRYPATSGAPSLLGIVLGGAPMHVSEVTERVS